MGEKEKVILRRAERYDPAAIARIIREGIDELGLAPRIRGTINDHMITFSEPRAIWGSIKQTGMGRTHGPYGLLEITNIKFVNSDFSRKKDRVWWFPYTAERLRGPPAKHEPQRIRRK
ncbi:MAG: hypothetical protein AB1715_12565 [Acidobacteriota bacterium]